MMLRIGEHVVGKPQRHSRWTVRAIAITISVLGTAAIGSAQQPRPSPTTERRAIPTWNKIARLSDGRILVTDGNIVLDATLAKPSSLPNDTVATGWLQGFFAEQQPNELRPQDLTLTVRGTTSIYSSPAGMLLNPKYIDYLRDLFQDDVLRLRCKGALDPVQIVVKGVAVGALMPMEP